MRNLYFDNASTSYPKPDVVATQMAHFMTHIGGTYSRGAYKRVMESSYIVEQCRDKMLEILGANLEDNLVFTSNATEAANLLLQGLELKDCKILISPLEHNAIMRPLEWLKDNFNTSWELLPSLSDGKINLSELKNVDKKGVKLIIINHQSNINGVIQPIKEIKEWAKEIPVAIDASQSLGHSKVDVSGCKIDFLIFTGHKGLYGPTGTGGLYIKSGLSIKPLKRGGTATLSNSFQMPNSLPDSLEAGTPNMVGIAGLFAALEYNIESKHTYDDFLWLLKRVKGIKNINIYCANNEDIQGELFSITHNLLPIYKLSEQLYNKYEIECRAGIHCAPLAHRYLGIKEGAIRFSLSPYHSREDLEYLYKSLLEICE